MLQRFKEVSHLEYAARFHISEDEANVLDETKIFTSTKTILFGNVMK